MSSRYGWATRLPLLAAGAFSQSPYASWLMAHRKFNIPRKAGTTPDTAIRQWVRLIEFLLDRADEARHLDLGSSARLRGQTHDCGATSVPASIPSNP